MNNPKVIPKKNESSPNIQSDNNMLAVPQKNANGRPTSSRPTSSRPKSALRKAGQKQVEQGANIYMGINQVLKYEYKGQNFIYFVPCYMRMRVLRINQINYIESKAELQAEVRLWLQIKEFPEVVQEQIINQAKLEVNSATKIEFENIREPSKLDTTQIKNTAKNAVGFLYTEKMELNIDSDPFWSPYETVKLFANLEIKKITLGQGNPQFKENLIKNKVDKWEQYWEASVEFNFIDANSFLQFVFGSGKLGCFDIIQHDVDMKYSSDAVGEEQQPQQMQEEGLNMVGDMLGIKTKQQRMIDGQVTPDAYEHGQITIPLYKYPSTTIINVFVPLFVVGIMSFGVFFEDNDMSNRDQGLAAYLLSYIAFLPTIRQNLPQTPKIVFTQILVYMQVACSLICFFYSLYINQQEDYQFVWSETPALLACLAITILNIMIVIGMFLIHKTVWERQYNTLPDGAELYMDAKYMNTDDAIQWYNKECEAEFKQFMDLKLLKPYVYKIDQSFPSGDVELARSQNNNRQVDLLNQTNQQLDNPIKNK